MCNNLSIPLPTDSSEEDIDSEGEETEEEATMYSLVDILVHYKTIFVKAKCY